MRVMPRGRHAKAPGHENHEEDPRHWRRRRWQDDLTAKISVVITADIIGSEIFLIAERRLQRANTSLMPDRRIS